MNSFYMIMPGKFEELKRFIWATKQDERLALFLRIVGVKLNEIGLNPIYQPRIVFEKRAGQLLIEVSLSVWKSWLILIDRNGIHSTLFDIRKDADEESDL